MAVSDLLDDSRSVSEDIGATLRNAREAAGFSIADVAERLRLSRHHIENLEAERFDLFPVAVFLRGYLTSYARLLGIDAGPLLEQYDRRGFGPPQLHSQDTAQATPRGSEFTVAVTTLVVIAVLIVLIAFWWRDQWNRDPEITGELTELSEDGDLAPDAGDAPRDPPGAPLAGTGDAPDVPGRPADGRERPGDTADAAGDESATLLSGRETPPGVDAPAEETVAGEVAPSDAEGASVQGAAPEAPAAQPAPGLVEPAPAGQPETAAVATAGALASLVIRVREDCWLMIRDADQRLVYRDIAAAGTVLEFSALPPIRIVAGYASGIELEYNGEPFDLSPFVEQDTGTARFRLGS